MRPLLVPLAIGRFRVLLAALIATALVSTASCAGDSASTPTPGPSVTPQASPTPFGSPGSTPGDGWTPDGVLGPGEYERTNTYGNYEVHWRSDSQRIYVGMRARTSGFVALGIQPGSRMKDADIVLGFVKDGVVSIYDMFSTGDFGPHPPDTEQGGSDDIADFGGREEGGFTTVEFARALETGDRFDNPLSAGLNRIIWSYGGADSLTFRHSTRGYGEIDL